jgi:hypothetical protein
MSDIMMVGHGTEDLGMSAGEAHIVMPRERPVTTTRRFPRARQRLKVRDRRLAAERDKRPVPKILVAPPEVIRAEVDV